jgi:general secretion pathway protein L
MSVLVVSLPPRPRLRARSAPPVDELSTTSDDDFSFLLSSDGFNVQSQGRCGAALLPKADSVVAVLADADVSWHRITLPKAPATRLRAALTGVLEEAVLDDADSTHFALEPGAAAGQPTWVAAVNRPWLRAILAHLEQRQVFVDRVVPSAWPDPVASGHFSELDAAPGSDGRAPMVLTWAHADGVAVLRLQGGLARAMLPTPLPAQTRFTATPEVATAAERWVGGPVLVVSPNERALQATRTLWNLRQFDLARRNRGTRAVRDFWRQWRSPSWRPVRYGLIALATVQLVGLNAWAWHQRSQIDEKRSAMVSLLQTTFPQVRAVLDAPLQMQREVDSLRTLAGKPSDADLEPLLQAAMSAWPISQPPVESMKFEPGRLTLAASGWSADEIEQFRSQLRPAGWQVDAAEGRLNLSRSAAGVSP